MEAYHYDGECLAKAEELGKPGVLSIKQLQARVTAFPLLHVGRRMFGCVLQCNCTLRTKPVSVMRCMTVWLPHGRRRRSRQSVQTMHVECMGANCSRVFCACAAGQIHLAREGHRQSAGVPNVSNERTEAHVLTLLLHAGQDKFIFRVEGTGVLPAEDVVATALDVLIAKLRNLQARAPARALRILPHTMLRPAWLARPGMHCLTTSGLRGAQGMLVCRSVESRLLGPAAWSHGECHREQSNVGEEEDRMVAKKSLGY